jgi:hypothetical protein
MGRCLLMALSGHPFVASGCPLSGVKRTWAAALQMSASDPKQTWPIGAHAMEGAAQKR